MKNSHKIKISKKYAQSLFESLSPDEIDDMNAALEELVQTWTSNEMLKDAVENPLTPSKVIVEVIKILGEKIRPGSIKFVNFLEQVAIHKRLQYLPWITNAFTEIVEKSRGILKVYVSSAFNLSDEEKTVWHQRLSEEYKSFIDIKWQVDPSLIGGIVLKIGDRVLDNSLRNSLRKLEVDLL